MNYASKESKLYFKEVLGSAGVYFTSFSVHQLKITCQFMQQLTSHYLVLQPSHFPLAWSIAQVTHKETRHGLEGLQGKGSLVLYNHTVLCTAKP